MRKKITLALFLGAVVAAGAFGWARFDRVILSDLPEDLSELRDFRPLTAVEILDRNGARIDSFYLERRYWVSLDALPKHVWAAFVSAEDQAFFAHRGIDLGAIARALLANWRAGDEVQGGSTLTQQLVKNLLLTREKSYTRKLKEIVLAWRLERELSKNEILQLYLNYVFLGAGNYGIEAAARDYFGVPAAELDPGEAALLAGLVPAPSRYNPRRDPELARWRRSLVLARMVDDGVIDAIDAIDLDDAPVLRTERITGDDMGASTAYVSQVRREVRRLFGPETPFKVGLRLRTPYDPAIQRVAVDATEEAVRSHLERQGPRVVLERSNGPLPADTTEACFPARVPGDRRLDALRTETATFPLRREEHWSVAFDERVARGVALRQQLRGGELLAVCRNGDGTVSLDRLPWSESAAIVVENATGRVVAATGGTDTVLEGFVRSTQARRQPGSSFKPYVFAAALEAGRTQMDVVTDAPLFLPAGGGKIWSPKNYGGGFAGPVTLRRALAGSLNSVAVRLALEVGPSEVARIARSLGVKTPLRTDLTMALGSSEVTPLDQAMAFAAIARMGVPVEPVWIDEVGSGEGEVLSLAGDTIELEGLPAELPGRPGPRAIDAGVAYELVDMMREVVRAGTARRAYADGLDRAGKTGTTNDFVDAWFVGFTPEHTVAVWIGTDGVATLGEDETGGRAALPAWLRIVQALPDQTGQRFAIPDEAIVVPASVGLLGFRRGHVPSAVLPRMRSGPGPLPQLR